MICVHTSENWITSAQKVQTRNWQTSSLVRARLSDERIGEFRCMAQQNSVLNLRTFEAIFHSPPVPSPIWNVNWN